ncbi:MAG: glycosyltransferase family 4 protein [bacterium]
MDMDLLKEQSISPHEPAQSRLPISNKKRGIYKPNISQLIPIELNEGNKKTGPKGEDPKKVQPSLSTKSPSVRNKKQKVAILSWECYPEENNGTESAHINKLAAALVKDGHEIHVFTRSGKKQPANKTIDRVHYHHIHVDSTLPLFKGISIFTNKICERIKKIETKEKPFDIIHCYNWHPARAVKSLQNGIPRRVVFTLHTNGCNEGLAYDNNFRSQQNLLEQELIKTSDSIVCFDQKVCSDIKNRFSLPEEKISIIQKEFHWQDYQWVKDPGEIKKKYDLWPLDPLVLFVGDLNNDYGPDILVDAIPSLLRNNPQLRFLLVGDGELTWPLRIKAHYLLFEHAIRLVGHKEGRDLQELFQAADIVVIPNRVSISPYQVLAAWSAKKPVIATHAGSYGLIKHLENGIQVYDNPNSIVWGIERVLFDWDKGHEISKKGWEEIEHNYTWDAIGHKIDRIYQAESKRAPKKRKKA